MLIGIVKKNAIMMIDFALEAQRKDGMESGRSDLPGLPGPLPPHHDDHDGRADGHSPDRLGNRSGRRGAPATWCVGRRRAGFFPIRDAFPYAGVLHLYGRCETMGRARLWPQARCGVGNRPVVFRPSSNRSNRHPNSALRGCPETLARILFHDNFGASFDGVHWIIGSRELGQLVTAFAVNGMVHHRTSEVLESFPHSLLLFSKRTSIRTVHYPLSREPGRMK